MKKYKQILVANWKMNLDVGETTVLAKKLKLMLAKEKLADKKVVFCPSFLAIAEVSKILKGSGISLGAQDVFYEKNGAFTGEISASSLKKLACDYVIVGHSERRALGETDEMVNKKAKAVLENNITPIICVGETLAEYKAGATKKVLARQVTKALKKLDNKYFILAYEPVWSISTSGSGKVISPAEAIAQIAVLKKNIPAHLNNFDIIYGGSVKADTVANFSTDFKGALVGGDSLKAQSFFKLIKNS
ncbi:MAG: triose-phosphate isomerase [Patescibacteria group bacterium]|jgi:triosephosphate isomerase